MLIHSLEEMFSLIFQLISTLRSRSQRLRRQQCGTEEHDGQGQKNEFHSPGDKSGWTQDQDSGSLSDLIALRSLACGSPARHRVFFSVGKAGSLSSATEVPEASEATDHVFFPEAVSPARLAQLACDIIR